MSKISYTFLRNNHTKQGRISTWPREQPGTTRKEKMMGDYTEHLISMAGGDGDDGLDLDAIQRRIPYIPEDEMSQAERDRKHLFAYARDLEARIGLVEALADQWRGQFAGSPTHLGAAIQQCINSIDNALESSLTATEGAA